MSDKHSELELKFYATKVPIQKFCKECLALGPENYLHILSPDVYYKHGDNVCRHRWSDGAGELTVKLRRDSVSTTNRVEVDLNFGFATTREDVTKFLELTGWKSIFTIVKDAHIFTYNKLGTKVSVVIYKCWTVAGKERPKTFIEVEVEKGNNNTIKQDFATLQWWRDNFLSRFQVGKPCNLSLYEIYSGERYMIERS